jgi:thiamine biosynthesis lipoprotein
VVRPVTPRLYRSLALADRAWRMTGGAFDPRVYGALARLGHRGASDPRPVNATIRTTERWLVREASEGAVAVTAPVDLGGIGKGLALRWALAAVARLGAPFGDSFGVMVDAGGDIVVAGTSPDDGPWLVGIEDPLGGETSLAVAAIRAGAVCTSSIRLARWTTHDGRAVHHLIDPDTGEPGGEGLVAVTVAAADPAWAEIWTKRVFLAGANRAADVARSRGLAAWWVTEAGELAMTPAARQATIWPA